MPIHEPSLSLRVVFGPESGLDPLPFLTLGLKPLVALVIRETDLKCGSIDDALQSASCAGASLSLRRRALSSS